MAKANSAPPVETQAVTDEQHSDVPVETQAVTDEQHSDVPVETQAVTETVASEPEAQASEPPKSEAAKPEVKPGIRKIKNASCKGMIIKAVTGLAVVFDASGVAECREADYQHFKKIPGYEDVQ